MTGEAEADGVVTGINVTPLVDIMLVLLIIFMVTARLTSEGALKINLPKAAAAQPASATPSLVVALDAAGALKLGGDRVELPDLEARLGSEAARDPSVRVTLAADGSLPYRKVVAALDAIKKAGVTRVALAAEK